jgi:hypothetical protein
VLRSGQNYINKTSDQNRAFAVLEQVTGVMPVLDDAELEHEF